MENKHLSGKIKHIVRDMKRTMFISFMLMSFGFVNAQNVGDAFVCTGDHVNVRTGPGTNYPVCTLSLAVFAESDGSEYNGETIKHQLDKGYGTYETHIEYLGKRQNGFLFVNCYEEAEGFGGEGWVSEKYLKPLCPLCKGEPEQYGANGKVIKRCSHCQGKGYVEMDKQ